MIDSYTLYNVCAYLLILTSYSVSPRGAATEGVVGYVPPPHFKIYRDLLWSPPHFYHNIYFDWLVPPTYKIVPALLISPDERD